MAHNSLFSVLGSRDDFVRSLRACLTLIGWPGQSAGSSHRNIAKIDLWSLVGPVCSRIVSDDRVAGHVDYDVISGRPIALLLGSLHGRRYDYDVIALRPSFHGLVHARWSTHKRRYEAAPRGKNFALEQLQLTVHHFGLNFVICDE